MVSLNTSWNTRPALLLILLASCSSPAPSNGQPENVPPQAPGDILHPDTGRLDTAQAVLPDSQDTFFEGSEHVWLDARERGVTFRAIGQEPGWLVEISGDRTMRVVTDYGAVEFIIAPVPRAVVDATTRTTTYSARADGSDVQVRIRDVPCADTMSGQRFSATVTLSVNGISHHGCGRTLSVPP
jgi:uncharacterized membrane protein